VTYCPRAKAPEEYTNGHLYFCSPSTDADMQGSNGQEVTHDSFLGFKLPSALKEKAKREAKRRGISVSKLVRRRLKDLEKGRQDRLAAA